MSRTDDDTWVAASVGVTATMVASARAAATRHGDMETDPHGQGAAKYLIAGLDHAA
jgi:hypothetical protein